MLTLLAYIAAHLPLILFVVAVYLAAWVIAALMAPGQQPADDEAYEDARCIRTGHCGHEWRRP